MSDLIFLAESNVEDLLVYNDIFPKSIYTDIKLFNNIVPYLDKENIVIMIRGMRNFNMLQIEELYKRLNEQINSEHSGLKSLTVLTDVSLNNFDTYYMYDIPDLINLRKCHKGRIIKRNINIWKGIDYNKYDKAEVFDNSEYLLECELEKLKNMKHSIEYEKLKKLLILNK